MSPQIQLNTEIKILIETIKKEILNGKLRIETTIENEKTITYWNLGKHIYEHLLQHKDRADYGDYLFKTLAAELGMRIRILYRAIQFYESYPKIVSAPTQLTWTHYTLLMTVKDAAKRVEYERLVVEEQLSTRELQELIHYAGYARNPNN